MKKKRQERWVGRLTPEEQGGERRIDDLKRKPRIVSRKLTSVSSMRYSEATRLKMARVGRGEWKS